MSEELRPCPFCNIPPASRTSKIDGKEYYSCFNADCPNVSWFTADEWNTRPIEDALHTRIAELEEENEKAFDLIKALRMYCIQAEWDNPDAENEFNEFDAEVCKWLSEFMERER